MPQYDHHPFLTGVPLGHPLYRSVFTLVGRHDGKSYPTGTACLIAPNYLVTAKHIFRHLKKEVAGLNIDETSPEIQESSEGPDWDILTEYGIGLEALRIHDDGHKQVFVVTGYVHIKIKTTDLAILRIEPHYGYQQPKRIDWHSLTLDLIPPKAGTKIVGYGYPDHPDYRLEHPDYFLTDHFAYQSTGEVLQVNLENNIRNFHTTMLTESGLSGGPVFVRRAGGYVCCGIISKGGAAYSSIAPLWQLAWGMTDPLPGLPSRDGKVFFADLMHSGIIQTLGSEHITVFNKAGFGLHCRFDDEALLKHGY